MHQPTRKKVDAEQTRKKVNAEQTRKQVNADIRFASLPSLKNAVKLSLTGPEKTFLVAKGQQARVGARKQAAADVQKMNRTNDVDRLNQLTSAKLYYPHTKSDVQFLQKIMGDDSVEYVLRREAQLRLQENDTMEESLAALSVDDSLYLDKIEEVQAANYDQTVTSKLTYIKFSVHQKNKERATKLLQDVELYKLRTRVLQGDTLTPGERSKLLLIKNTLVNKFKSKFKSPQIDAMEILQLSEKDAMREHIAGLHKKLLDGYLVDQLIPEHGSFTPELRFEVSNLRAANKELKGLFETANQDIGKLKQPLIDYLSAMKSPDAGKIVSTNSEMKSSAHDIDQKLIRYKNFSHQDRVENILEIEKTLRLVKAKKLHTAQTALEEIIKQVKTTTGQLDEAKELMRIRNVVNDGHPLLGPDIKKFDEIFQGKKFDANGPLTNEIKKMILQRKQWDRDIKIWETNVSKGANLPDQLKGPSSHDTHLGQQLESFDSMMRKYRGKQQLEADTLVKLRDIVNAGKRLTPDEKTTLSNIKYNENKGVGVYISRLIVEQDSWDKRIAEWNKQVDAGNAHINLASESGPDASDPRFKLQRESFDHMMEKNQAILDARVMRLASAAAPTGVMDGGLLASLTAINRPEAVLVLEQYKKVKLQIETFDALVATYKDATKSERLTKMDDMVHNVAANEPHRHVLKNLVVLQSLVAQTQKQHAAEQERAHFSRQLRLAENNISSERTVSVTCTKQLEVIKGSPHRTQEQHDDASKYITQNQAFERTQKEWDKKIADWFVEVQAQKSIPQNTVSPGKAPFLIDQRREFDRLMQANEALLRQQSQAAKISNDIRVINQATPLAPQGRLTPVLQAALTAMQGSEAIRLLKQHKDIKSLEAYLTVVRGYSEAEKISNLDEMKEKAALSVEHRHTLNGRVEALELIIAQTVAAQARIAQTTAKEADDWRIIEQATPLAFKGKLTTPLVAALFTMKIPRALELITQNHDVVIRNVREKFEKYLTTVQGHSEVERIKILDGMKKKAAYFLKHRSRLKGRLDELESIIVETVAAQARIAQARQRYDAQLSQASTMLGSGNSLSNESDMEIIQTSTQSTVEQKEAATKHLRENKDLKHNIDEAIMNKARAYILQEEVITDVGLLQSLNFKSTSADSDIRDGLLILQEHASLVISSDSDGVIFGQVADYVSTQNSNCLPESLRAKLEGNIQLKKNRAIADSHLETHPACANTTADTTTQNTGAANTGAANARTAQATTQNTGKATQNTGAANAFPQNTGAANTGAANTGAANASTQNTGKATQNTGTANATTQNTGAANVSTQNTGKATQNTGAANASTQNTGKATQNTGAANATTQNTGAANTGAANARTAQATTQNTGKATQNTGTVKTSQATQNTGAANTRAARTAQAITQNTGKGTQNTGKGKGAVTAQIATQAKPYAPGEAALVALEVLTRNSDVALFDAGPAATRSSWAGHEARLVIDHLQDVCMNLKFNSRIPYVAVLGMAHDIAQAESFLRGTEGSPKYLGILLTVVPLNKRLMAQYLCWLQRPDDDKDDVQGPVQDLYDVALLASISHMVCAKNGSTSLRINSMLFSGEMASSLIAWEHLPVEGKTAFQALIQTMQAEFVKIKRVMMDGAPMHIETTNWSLSDIEDTF